jgi:hypothetical protein
MGVPPAPSRRPSSSPIKWGRLLRLEGASRARLAGAGTPTAARGGRADGPLDRLAALWGAPSGPLRQGWGRPRQRICSGVAPLAECPPAPCEDARGQRAPVDGAPGPWTAAREGRSVGVEPPRWRVRQHLRCFWHATRRLRIQDCARTGCLPPCRSWCEARSRGGAIRPRS